MKQIKEILKKTWIFPVYKKVKKVLKKTKKKIKKKTNKYKNKLFKFLTLKVIFPLYYKKHAKSPVDEKKVVFIEVRLPDVSNNFTLLHHELTTNYDVNVNCHFLRSTFVGKKEYAKRCFNMLKDIATAKYVFLNEASNVISCINKRPETTITQTWHGCGAFKKFGLGTADLIFGGNREEQLKYPNYGNLDYVTVSSPEVIWAYEQSMNIPVETVIPAGVSRTDIFYNDEFIKKAYDKLHELMPESKGKKVILYAPTFRGRVAKAKAPNKLDIDLLKESFSDEYVLLCKYHPIIKKPPKISEENSDFARDFTKEMTIEELLCISDICISDYSSLVFEYSLFEKPLIFFAYDLENYCDWRGFYYDYHELTPGPVLSDNLQIINYIKNIEEEFDKQQVIDFKNKFMSACDGNATERIMDLVFKDNLEAYKKKELSKITC